MQAQLTETWRGTASNSSGSRNLARRIKRQSGSGRVKGSNWHPPRYIENIWKRWGEWRDQGGWDYVELESEKLLVGCRMGVGDPVIAAVLANERAHKRTEAMADHVWCGLYPRQRDVIRMWYQDYRGEVFTIRKEAMAGEIGRSVKTVERMRRAGCEELQRYIETFRAEVCNLSKMTVP